MRLSLLLSAALHVVLVTALLASAPRRFEPVREQVEEVELVPEKDAPQPPQEKEERKEEPKPEKQSVWDFPPEKPRFDLPRLEPTQQTKKNGPAESQAASKQKAQQKAAETPPQQPSAAEQPPATVSQQPAQSPSNSQQAALTPQQQGGAPPASGFGSPNPAGSIFDPANIPKLMDL